MDTSVQHIEETRLALTEALDRSDWDRIGDLDQLCRRQVEDALVASAGQEEALRTQLEMLMDVYRQLTKACIDAREEVASELVALQKASHGAKVYQLFG
ncbi:flagellar protein FliT [Pseudomonas mangiferae]|uniref:Flagellar protein FliT n=1 Tax=Pseudomonas mangiferae TaxID=2593654 RepID=A0A553GY64_9PSED|nr:flagellar protein FliT [Pseudomonas mangiferae]TRX74451.1 flagellar protein FliT [Pseudomonas mangiferae]